MKKITVPKYALEIALLGVAKKAVRRTLECVQIKGNMIISTNSHVAIAVTNPPTYLTDDNDVNVLITGQSLATALKAFAKEPNVTLSVSDDSVTLSNANGAVVPLDTMDDWFPDIASLDLGAAGLTESNIGAANLAIIAKVGAILTKHGASAPDYCTIALQEKGMTVTFGDAVKILVAGFVK